jgi:P27 family predicted phage terminase small subunit
LPTPLKLLRGTLEKSRENKNEAKPKVKIPRIPKHLLPEQKKYFRYFAKLLLPAGLVTEIDGTALAMLAQTWDRYVKASEKYNSVGPVVLSPNKFPIQNPYLAVLNKAQEQYLKLEVEFGMTPSSRSRVRSNNETPEGKLDRLMR